MTVKEGVWSEFPGTSVFNPAMQARPGGGMPRLNFLASSSCEGCWPGWLLWGYQGAPPLALHTCCAICPKSPLTGVRILSDFSFAGDTSHVRRILLGVAGGYLCGRFFSLVLQPEWSLVMNLSGLLHPDFERMFCAGWSLGSTERVPHSMVCVLLEDEM